MCNTLIPPNSDEHSLHAATRSHNSQERIGFFFSLLGHRLNIAERTMALAPVVVFLRRRRPFSFILYFSVLWTVRCVVVLVVFIFTFGRFSFVNFMYGNWINGSFGLLATSAHTHTFAISVAEEECIGRVSIIGVVWRAAGAAGDLEWIFHIFKCDVCVCNSICRYTFQLCVDHATGIHWPTFM